MSFTKPDDKPDHGIQIQYLALLVNHLYQKHDTKLRGSQLINIEHLPECPPSIVHGGPTGRAAKLPTTMYTLTVNLDQDQPSLSTFFGPNMGLPLKEKENAYWKIRLMYCCSVLPISLILVMRKLGKFGYTHFTGTIGSKDGVGEEIKIPFSEVSLRELAFVPEALSVTEKLLGFGMKNREIIEGLSPGYSYIRHNIITCNEDYVLDMTAMQFGMRGKQGELIGRLEPLADYIDRFPGELAHLAEKMSLKEFEFNVAGQRKLNQFCIDPTAADVLSCLEKKERWCYFCGSIENAGSKLSLCGACRNAAYCDRHCQKSDWAGHKMFCSNGKDTHVTNTSK